MNKTKHDIDNHIGNCPRCENPARMISFDQCEACEAVICFRCYSTTDRMCYACMFRNSEMRDHMQWVIKNKLRGVVAHPEREATQFKSVLVHEDVLPILESLGLAVIF